MSNYIRVIPRDLFNEASLLKCYGQLYLNLELLGMEDCLSQVGDGFDIVQDESGFTTIDNMFLIVNGHTCSLLRPLNARSPYPLYLYTHEKEIQIFTDDGVFTPEMIDYLQKIISTKD